MTKHKSTYQLIKELHTLLGQGLYIVEEREQHGDGDWYEMWYEVRKIKFDTEEQAIAFADLMNSV